MLKYNLPKIITLGLFLGLFISAVAQPINYMVLSKPGKAKRYTFIEGQEITYRLKNDIGFFTDRVVKIKDSAIEFSTYTVLYDSIDKILISKKKHIIPNRTVLMYGVNILAATAILQVAYLVNSGAGIPDLGRNFLYLSSPVPVVLLSNWVYGLFVKTEYTLAEGEYQLRPVILRKD